MNATPHLFRNRLFDGDAAANLRLRIGEHVVDLGALRVVTNPGAPRLTSKAAAVLVELARHAGDTVTRDQLLDSVWRGRVTTPDVLTQAIKELRRAFADDAKPARYIETIPKVGYRLLANVSEADTPALRIASEAEHAPANDDAHADAQAARVAIVEAAPPRRSRYLLLGVGAALLVAIGLAVAMLRHPVAESAAAPGWRVSDIRAITSDPGPERRGRISPDGTRVVYTQMDAATHFERLLVRGIDQSSAMHITQQAIAHEEMPAWSPDGTRIAFERLIDKTEQCTMWIVPSMGGAETEVGPCGNYLVNFFNWTPDSKNLILSDQDAAAAGAGLPLAILDLTTGKKKVIDYQRDASDLDLDARYSPDGKSIVFRRGMAPHSDLFVMSAGGGAVRKLTHVDARIMGHSWTPDGGTIIYSTNVDGEAALYAIGVESGRVQALNVKPATSPDVARIGNTVVYEVPRTKTQLAAAAVASASDVAKGQEPQLLARSTGSDAAPAYSPDGRQIAFVSDRNGSQQVWVYAPDSPAEPYALTDFRGAAIWNPQWSSDGKQLLVTVRIGGKVGLMQIDLATHRRQDVALSQKALLSGSYGADPGSYLLIRRNGEVRGQLILLQDADTPQQKEIPLAAAVEHVELDRNTRMVYYTKFDDVGIFRRPLDGGAEQLVTRSITSTAMDGWRVVDGRVWYVTGMMLKPFDLREVDPATGADRALMRVNGWLHNVNFSVSPAHDRVLLAPMGPEDEDIGAFNLSGPF